MLDAVARRPELVGVSSIPMNVEVTSVMATKGTALLWLCEHLGVSPADTVAFGDSGNDVSMLEVAGDGVAMANACPECLAVADHVAPPVHGVRRRALSCHAAVGPVVPGRLPVAAEPGRRLGRATEPGRRRGRAANNAQKLLP